MPKDREFQHNLLLSLSKIVFIKPMDETVGPDDAEAVALSSMMMLGQACLLYPERMQELFDVIYELDPENVGAYEGETVKESISKSADELSKRIQIMVTGLLEISGDPWLPTREHNAGDHFLISNILHFNVKQHTFVNPKESGSNE